MSFIIGAFLKNKESAISNSLSSRMQKFVNNESMVIINEPFAIIIAGKRNGEPAAEQAIQIAGKAILSGRIFNKTDYETSSLDLNAVSEIEESQGKLLAQNYWGRYILATCNSDKQTISLFRDPQGLATVFVVELDEAIYFASELPALYDILSVKPEIDWQYFTSFVLGSHHLTSSTPFKGVFELFAGYGIELSANGISKQFAFWNPAKLKHAQVADEHYENNLINVFGKCVKAWTKDAKGVVAEVSGGADSSSVLFMLKDSLREDQSIVACNFYHASVASSDEREHAKQVAQACDTKLEFLDMQNYLPFDAEVKERFDKPNSLLMFRYGNYLNSYPGWEITTGQGGDHLFMAPPPIESVCDYFILNGFKGINTKIKEISAYYRMPIIKVISQNLKSYFKYKFGCIAKQETILPVSWMKKSLRERMNSNIFELPFNKDLKNVAPAKRIHISAIYQATAFIDRCYLQEDVPAINPFLSQPLVELALSIPTYSLYGEGRDRAPFRRGMHRFTKHDYIWRKTKGETSGVMMRGFNKNFDKLTDLLLNGRFAKENFIDKDLLHAHLQQIIHGKTDDLWAVINLISIEIWFKTWNATLAAKNNEN